MNAGPKQKEKNRYKRQSIIFFFPTHFFPQSSATMRPHRFLEMKMLSSIVLRQILSRPAICRHKDHSARARKRENILIIFARPGQGKKKHERWQHLVIDLNKMPQPKISVFFFFYFRHVPYRHSTLAGWIYGDIRSGWEPIQSIWNDCLARSV